MELIREMIVLLFLLGILVYVLNRQAVHKYLKKRWKRLRQEDRIHTRMKWWKKLFPTVIVWGMFLGLCYTNNNWPSIEVFQHQHVTSMTKWIGPPIPNESWSTWLFTPSVKSLLRWMSYLGAGTLMYFGLRLPYLTLESLNFLGVGYKVQSEQAKTQEFIKTADLLDLAQERMMNWANLLEILTTSEVYIDLESLFPASHAQIDRYGVSTYLNRLIQTIFSDEVGVVFVSNGIGAATNADHIPDPHQFSILSDEVRNTIYRVITKAKSNQEPSEMRFWAKSDDSKILAYTYSYEIGNDYLVLFMRSEEIKFFRADADFAQTALCIVEGHLLNQKRQYFLQANGHSVQMVL